jgi:16S rRNA processing protein RimM
MMAAKKNKRNSGSGSPSTGEPEYLVVGHLRRPHGLHGEMVMEIHSDFPERLKPGVEVYIGDLYQKMVIEGVRFHNEGLLIKFQNIDSPEDAGRYRNRSVFVTAADRPDLPEGQYYHHELLGFAVLDENNNLIGTLTEIMQTGANDVYVVRRDDGREVLLPVIASVILSIEFDAHQIRVKPLAGLLDGMAE